MEYDMLASRYPSRRSVLYGQRGMVCTSQPLAANAGLDVLKRGGNAIDAAICAAVCLTVLEPTSNGLGSDAFALIWAEGKLHGLNGSGYAPSHLSIEALKKRGYTATPERGWASVTVPGAPSAWAELHKRFGRLSFVELFTAAIEYAENGFPVQPVTSRAWQEAAIDFADYNEDPLFAPFWQTFFINGLPRAGKIIRLPDVAQTLADIADSRAESFYRGRLARIISDYATQTGGFISEADLADYHAEWVMPISTEYRGYEVCELPPNGHGLVVLMALNILKKLKLGGRDESATIHRQLEAMKLAFADGQEYIADAKAMQTSIADWLSDDYAKRRSAEISEEALDPRPISPHSGGTVYLCTADSEGNMVSFIQSNFRGFGSGIVIPNTGISLNNRATGFSWRSDSANRLAPRKKPYHTIIPGFLLKDGKAVGPFGVMGAFMQPQGHVQVVMNMLDFGLNPQEALDAPRWQWLGGKRIEVERGLAPETVEELRQRGHDIAVNDDFFTFGRGQIILRDENGVLIGATEPRADGLVAAW